MAQEIIGLISRVLLIISEILPMIKSCRYNGLFDFIIGMMFHCTVNIKYTSRDLIQDTEK
jgi:hypothetical protein